MSKKTPTFAEGAKVLVKDKDGATSSGVFISAAAGWANVTVKGTMIKTRISNVSPAKAEKTDKAKVVKLKTPKAEGEGDDRLVPADLSRYVLHDTKTASGRKQIDVDDATAEKLREMDLPGVYKYAAKVLDESVKDLIEKYKNLNPGMQRMNLGNRIRKAMKIAAEVHEGVDAKKKAA